jgi:hypothetical protein
VKYIDPNKILELPSSLLDSTAFGVGVKKNNPKQPILVFYDDERKPLVGIRFKSMDDLNTFTTVLEKKGWEHEHGEF